MLYTVAGIALFITGESPVLQPGVAFLGDKFRMVWAGWKLCGCFYYALVNLWVDIDLAMVLAMLPYALCDEFAAMDGAHWSRNAAFLPILDGAAGGVALVRAGRIPRLCCRHFFARLLGEAVRHDRGLLSDQSEE